MNRTGCVPPLCLAGLLVLASGAPAGAAADKPKAVRIAGRVVATQGGRLNATAGTITTADHQVFNIQIDSRGRSLIEVMHNAVTEVRGVVSEKYGAKWIKVLRYADVRLLAAHELWRRMRCNACVVMPAIINASAPTDLQGAAPISGRPYSFKARFTAWARDAKNVWVATDTDLRQIDLAGRRVTRTYDLSNGLPDQIIRELASDGRTLWIVYHGGVAALTVGADRIVDLPRFKSAYAKVVVDRAGAWVIADTGTWRLASPDAEPTAFPALPTAGRITRAVKAGIWLPHWQRRTGHFITAPVSVADRLYVGSYGAVFELAGGAWRRIAPQGWDLQTAASRVWFVAAGGLVEHDPQTGKQQVHALPDGLKGRVSRFLVTAKAAWLGVEPNPTAGAAAGGGLARFDLTQRTWQVWHSINDHAVNRVAALSEEGGAVSVVAMNGHYKAKPAHPGMTYVKQSTFEPAGLHLHRYAPAAGQWTSVALERPVLPHRLICGQDGANGTDAITLGDVRDICVGPKRVMAVTHLVPVKYVGGYWPCVDQIAVKEDPDGGWRADFEHHPEQLHLQGEQPEVLNISNGELMRSTQDMGDRILEAVGHDGVLGLFLNDGRQWAVTEGRVACFDEDAGRWRTVAEADIRYYWRALTAADDGRFLLLGSDRGLVSRLDLRTGRFERQTALLDRSISRIALQGGGRVVIGSRLAPLGMLATDLRDTLKPLDCDVARFDGKTWAPARQDDLPRSTSKPPWFVKRIRKRHRMDKSRGNFLWGPAAGSGKAGPRFYVKEVFFPRFLCASPDGKRLWLSTYSGLLRLDCAGAAGGAGR